MPSHPSLLEQARQAQASGDLRAARDWAAQAVRQDPGLEAAWLLLAEVSKPRAAVSILERALRRHPGSAALRARLKQARSLAALDSRRQAPGPAGFVAPIDRYPAGVPRAGLLGLSFRMAAVSFLLSAVLGVNLAHWNIQLGFGAGEPRARIGMETQKDGQRFENQEGVSSWTDPVVTPSPSATPQPTLTPSPTFAPSPTFTPTVTAILPPADRTTHQSIVVRIGQQHVYAFEGETLVMDFPASTGRDGLTLKGRFAILDKIPNAYSNPWGFRMPYWMGIYWVGYNLENGFHSLPVLSSGEELWGDQIGTPVTYGCVVLQPEDMRRLFEWAEVGTMVDIVE